MWALVDKKELPCDVLEVKYDFIRFKFNDHYLDKEFVKIKTGTKYLITMGETIDCSVPSREKRKK